MMIIANVLSISEQGARLEMEDTCFLDANFGGKGWLYGGIYDGHGGKFAAQYVAQHLHRVVLGHIMSGGTPQAAFIIGYETVSDSLQHQTSGTTAADFIITDESIITANAGDSRVILISRDKVVQLTTDHRVDNVIERRRILTSGGLIEGPYVVNNSTGLMPTRSLGDTHFRHIGIIPTPAVSVHRVSADDLFLIAACDGLFDVLTNLEIADLVRHYGTLPTILEAIKTEVLINRRGMDNLTVIGAQLTIIA